MNKRQIYETGSVAIEAILRQLLEDETWALATATGVYQGLKYNGSIKRGLTTGAAMLGVLSGANAIKNVVQNWHWIKKVK